MKGESGPWCGETPTWIQDQLPGGSLGSAAEDIARVANALTERVIRVLLDGHVQMSPAVKHGLEVLVSIHSDPQSIRDFDRLVFQANTNLKEAVTDTAGGTE